MIQPHLDFEKQVWAKGNLCCGLDEVGRGCLAGPVVAAAVVFPPNHQPHQKIRDSKKMTPRMRREMYDFILDTALDIGIGLVPAQVIDEMGITGATELAMREAHGMLKPEISLTLVDGRPISDFPVNQKAVIKGDAHIYSISAASIVAKVFRDTLVSGLDNDYEGYYFGEHKGYGTEKHFEVINKNGLTKEHRRSFLKKLVDE